MKKMFLKVVLLCLCLWRLTGVTGVTVMEGDSFTLDPDLIEIKDDDLIQWSFGIENTLIAEINKQNNSFTVYDDVLDGRFRDRLKLDNQTGSLTITNTTMKHSSRYNLLINGERKISFFSAVVGVTGVTVMEGDSFTLDPDLIEIKDDDLIQWSFGIVNTLIAEINKQNNSFTVYDDVLDGRFRKRLKLDNQTGSLTITNITMKHSSRYNLLINGERKMSFFYAVVVQISVNEGDSVTLNTLTEIKDEYVIQWRFGNEETLIAETNKETNNITVFDDVLDGRFRNRLKLDNQTGSLTITNITIKHAGAYELVTYGDIKLCFYLIVIVQIPVKEGDSVTLNPDFTEIKEEDDQIWWRFGSANTVIAEINKQNDSFTVYDDVLDGRFRNRLKLDNQTESLTITNITMNRVGSLLWSD